MISLEIAISNFKPINYQEEPTSSLTLKFGEISTVLSLNGGEGGKCLYLNLSAQELQEIYHSYACGLFILNRNGKFFSLLSFENMKIEDKIICNEIVFYNDVRQVKYQCEFSFVAKGFKNPKIADTGKIEARQNALAMLKKPQVPKQNSPPKQKSQKKQNKKQVTSFLYGNKEKQVIHSTNYDNLQTLKEDLRRQNEVKSRLQKQKNQSVQLPKAAFSKGAQYFDQDDPFQNNPPVMEFTNDEPETAEILRVPQMDYITYQESIQRSKQSRGPPRPPKQNNFLTFNKYDKTSSKDSPQGKIQKESRIVAAKKELSKEEIKKLAKQEAQSRTAKENVMIPIARGGKFQLLPLSSLKPQEIIEYVQRQRKNEEDAIAFEQRKRRLQEREQQLQEKNRKLQQLVQRRESEKERETVVKRPSKEIRQSVHKQIKEEDSSEQQQNEEDYMSDFQSMSASNSVIKSRLSSRGNQKNISKEEESIIEDEYSQDFDSYSHSALSKTNPRNPTHSISDYSQSFRSISQSYRK